MKKEEIGTIVILIKDLINKIFENKDIDKLSLMEKRKIVFDYLVNNNEYDFVRLNKIYTGSRNLFEEIKDVLKTNELQKNKGVCHAIASAYKLACEELNIANILVNCEIETDDIEFLKRNNIRIAHLKHRNGKFVIRHMLNLVDNGDGTMSFDDITETILNKGTEKQNLYFGYNKELAKKEGQVNFKYISQMSYLNLESDLDNSMGKKFGWKDPIHYFFKEPSTEKIKSVKEINKKNNEKNIDNYILNQLNMLMSKDRERQHLSDVEQERADRLDR